MSSIILFPGQGAQFIGMGKKLLNIPIINRMFELANNVFKRDVLNLCINGPDTELNQTINCQVAVYVTSLGAVEKLKQENPTAIEKCTATAGFSVGEYAALVFSGAITFEDGLQLIKKRSQYMQKASELVPSGLLSVFIGHDSQLSEAIKASKIWCEQKLGMPQPIVCSISSYLYPDCKVIGGNIEALNFIEQNQTTFKLRRVKRVPVSGAFHTKLMKITSDEKHPLVDVLNNINISKPLIPTFSNVTASPYEHEKQIKRYLIEQISAPVKWEQIMHKIYERPVSENETELFPDTYECGPGKQLGTILKLVNKKAFRFYKNIEV